jgi:hypothetical protein
VNKLIFRARITVPTKEDGTMALLLSQEKEEQVQEQIAAYVLDLIRADLQPKLGTLLSQADFDAISVKVQKVTLGKAIK